MGLLDHSFSYYQVTFRLAAEGCSMVSITTTVSVVKADPDDPEALLTEENIAIEVAKDALRPYMSNKTHFNDIKAVEVELT